MVRFEGRGVVNVFVCSFFRWWRFREDTVAYSSAAGACRVFYGETHQDSNHNKIKLLAGGRKVHRPPATGRMPRLDGLQVSKRAALDVEGPAQRIK